MTAEERIQSLEQRVYTLEKFIISMYQKQDINGSGSWRTKDLDKDVEAIESNHGKDKWRF